MSSAAVDAVVSAGGAELPGLLAAVEERMRDLARGHGQALARHAGDTLAAGGKRLRPLLVCLAAGEAALDSPLLVPAAVAVELIHAATLVHDDVLDRADLRRARPTVVALAGRRAATATGDLLFSRAFAELATAGSAPAVATLSRACSELARGELLQRADAYHAEVRVERYLERCRLKTGVLFAAACELGALAAAEDPAALGRFGVEIGVAFQILDDVLDISGPPERTGKPRGADLLDGTVTLPLLLAFEADPDLRRIDLHEIRTAEAAARVCERIAASGALEQARQRALAMVSAGKQRLEGLDARRRHALELVADGVVERYA
ncbi:MAG TPA: polyprenyl synthetase family protein [Solirubrobacteraceae bacterium]|nr:polyprenyl synthetase family protein [Solirubrobacteraceae bacterium]